jgi:aspartate aminotransferase
MGFITDNLTKNIKPSLTALVEVKASELRAQGHKVISLGIGEPDFETPENIKEAAIDAIKKGYTKYMPSGGSKGLREAIINKMRRDSCVEYNLNEVCVSSGAKQVIYNAFMATINSGDEVIILAPYWVSYPEMVKMAGGKPVIVACDSKNDFGLIASDIERAITSKTKWVMINSPNNPCGSVYSYNELRALADVLLKYENVHILCDDIYEYFIYDQNKFCTLVEIEPKLKDRILIVNGMSKAYAMTGWRIGYGAGSEELIKAMKLVQSQSTSGACSISQMAAIEALNGPQDFVKECNEAFKRRRDIVVKVLNEASGLKCVSPKGAFYVFVDCSELFGKSTSAGNVIKDSNDLATYFLEEAHVAVVSGESFGVRGFFRISYAVSDEDLYESCNKLKDACRALI